MNITILFRPGMSKYVVKIMNQPLSCVENIHLVGFTNFQCFISTVYKFGLVYTLLLRCFDIPSSYQKFINENN